MSFQKTFTRSVSSLMVLVLGLSLFAFAPLASAAQVVMVFLPTPLSTFNVHEGGTHDSTVNISGMTDDVKVEFYVKGPIGDPGETEEMIESYWYIAPGDYVFVWDGKMGGQFVASGTYELRFEGLPLLDTGPEDLLHEVEVEGASHFTFIDADDPYYTTSTSDFEMNVHIDTLSDSCPVFRIGPTGETNETATIEMNLPSGDHLFTWDGEYGGGDAPAGEYTYHLFNDLCGDSADLYGTIMVSNDPVPAEPTLSSLGMTIDPFSPDDDGDQDTTTVTFDLDVADPYTEADVTVTVDNSDGVEVRNLMDAEAQSPGTVNAVWDGEETGGSVVPDGTYTIKVTAENDGGSDSLETTVAVDTSATVPEPTPTPEPTPDIQCAGHTDVLKTHPYCDAIEFAQSIGAMEGNPDGTFAPNELVQRDQVAKISLETFNLFDDTADYCGGVDPFPDVPPSQWSYQYVCRGVEIDMITGYLGDEDAGFYRPSREVNRVEFLALILRNLTDTMPALSSTSYADVLVNQWFSGFAKYSLDNSLFVGVNLLPTKGTTRVEVADVLYKLDQAGKL